MRRSFLSGRELLLASAILLVITQVYLIPKVLFLEDGQDFRLLWIAGKMWTTGQNPYGPNFADHYRQFFGAPRPSHFFVYPPHWYPIVAPLGSLPFRSALLIWNIVSWTSLLLGSLCLALALSPRGTTRRPAVFFLIVSIGSVMQATSFSLALGQTSMLLFAGVAMFLLATLQRQRVLLGIALFIIMLKPQIGLPLLMLCLARSWTWQPVIAAGVVSWLFLLLPLVLIGPEETLRSFSSNLAAYNSEAAIANLPRHLIGAPKFLDMAGIGLPSLPILLGASVVVALAAVLSREDRVLLLLALLVVLFFSGIHTYDLTLALCLIPLLPRTAFCIAAAAAGFALILRPANLAKVLPAPWIDSDIFPGSVHVTLAICLFWLVAASSLRVMIVNGRRKMPKLSGP